ncbi:MAG: DNA-directed RNA polymerase II complex subunit Rpb4 [Amphiamblys sp. WSBS2006]|nr:MAG: DNA-directed RNA polymerase II complex subunit Rpb4 [Amphiamblys sp. WSBS2006]
MRDEEDAGRLVFDSSVSEGAFLSVSEALSVLTKHGKSGDTRRYAEEFSTFPSEDVSLDLKRTLCDSGLHVFEAVQMINLCPETVEEAKSIIPSLWSRDDGAVQRAIDETIASKNV